MEDLAAALTISPLGPSSSLHEYAHSFGGGQERSYNVKPRLNTIHDFAVAVAAIMCPLHSNERKTVEKAYRRAVAGVKLSKLRTTSPAALFSFVALLLPRCR